jgi:hypothetical protein
LRNAGRLQRNILQRSWRRNAQHRANERILTYKLEAYQKNFLDFIYGSPTSTKVSSHDEEIEAGPSGRGRGTIKDTTRP